MATGGWLSPFGRCVVVACVLTLPTLPGPVPADIAMLSSMRVRYGIAVVALMVLGLIGCGSSAPAGTAASSGPTSSRGAATPSVAPSTIPPTPWDSVDQFCAGGVPYSPHNPPYIGPGPHTLTIIPASESIEEPQFPTPPPAWDPEYADYASIGGEFTAGPDSHKPLLVCMSGAQREPGPPVGQCHFRTIDTVQRPVDIDMVPASYAFTVVAAHTGRVLKRFRLRGTLGTESCPEDADTSTTFIPQPVADDAFANKLRPLVMATVPQTR